MDPGIAGCQTLLTAASTGRDRMNLIDIIRLEPFQTGLEGLHEILPMIPTPIRIGRAPIESVFRRKHKAITLILRELAEQLFTHPLSLIHI